MRSTSQLYIVEGYVTQRTRLTVAFIRTEKYVICYSAVNKHPLQLYRLIHSVRGKGANTWPIFSVVHLRFPSGYARKVRDDPHLKNGSDNLLVTSVTPSL